jgi:hypothetical protein
MSPHSGVKQGATGYARGAPPVSRIEQVHQFSALKIEKENVQKGYHSRLHGNDK